MPRVSVDNVEPDAGSVPKPVTVPPVKPAPERSSSPAVASSEGGSGPVSGVDDELKQKSGTSMFSAFFAYPKNLTFNEQEEDEQIILLLRAHIITNIPWILATIVLLIVPLILFPLLAAIGVLPTLGFGLGFIITIFWYLGTFTYAFLSFLYWYFNVYIVTDERIVDVDWYSIVYRKVSSCQISKVQDVSASQVGALSGIFDFGNVDIQTAAELDNFTFERVPFPQLVAKKLQQLLQKEETQWEPHPDIV